MGLKLFHNPRCSKSRKALELLREKGQEPEIVLYLETPPAADEIKKLLRQLGIGARDLLRTQEEAYGKLGLSDASLDDDALIAAMAAHPQLIERPICIHGRRAVIGRPPEKVLDVL